MGTALSRQFKTRASGRTEIWRFEDLEHVQMRHLAFSVTLAD